MRRLLIYEYHPELKARFDEDLAKELFGEKNEPSMEDLKLAWNVYWNEIAEPHLKKTWGLIQQVVKDRISKLNPAHVKVYRDSVAYPRLFETEIKEGIAPDVFKDLLEFGAKFIQDYFA